MYIRTLGCYDHRIYEAEKIGENRHLTTTGKEIGVAYESDDIEGLIVPTDFICIKVKVDNYTYFTHITMGLENAEGFVKTHKRLSENETCGNVYSYEYYLLREIKGRNNKISFKAVAFRKDGEKFKLL